jgi:hypothetical protein
MHLKSTDLTIFFDNEEKKKKKKKEERISLLPKSRDYTYSPLPKNVSPLRNLELETQMGPPINISSLRNFVRLL